MRCICLQNQVQDVVLQRLDHESSWKASDKSRLRDGLHSRMFARLSAPSLPGLNMEEVLTSASERSACAADANDAPAAGQTPP